VIDSLPPEYITASSTLGSASPKFLVIIPFLSHEKLYGVIELAYFKPVDEAQIRLLENIQESIAMAYENLYAKIATQEALEKEQSIFEELQVQEEELRVSNEKLQEKSENLIEQKEELLLANKYKSEFLANMSHELRTPLNSLLILSQSLAQNEEKHLSQDEVESARVIHESGEHLLSLINDILDISKVEAGQMVVSQENISMHELLNNLESRFIHMAEKKNISFEIEMQENCSLNFVSDRKKLGQIITNLVSNALKFTQKGGVKLFCRLKDNKLYFSVKDTGIGIPKEKQEIIFEAFKQADGATNRNFGGTGLGLSISISFAKLLGGHVDVESKEGEGSTFTLVIPYMATEQTADFSLVHEQLKSEFVETLPPFADDREVLDKSKLLFIIIEDDENFAKILYDTCKHDGYQALVACDGESGVLLAQRYSYAKGIILDYMLPGLDGSDILALLKEDEKTKNIPVHIMSALDNLIDMKHLGAIGQLQKPISKEQIQIVLSKFETFSHVEHDGILLFGDNEENIEYINEVLHEESMQVTKATSLPLVLEKLQEKKYLFFIVDLSENTLELLEQIYALNLETLPQIFIFSERNLTQKEQNSLEKYTHKVIVKSHASKERMVDEVQLFTHHVKSQPLETKDDSSGLEGKTILIVDDDMRNTYSLAKIFRAKKLTVHVASNGKRALEVLQEHDDVEIILMDIMMPNMDGYEATREIHAIERYKNIPIIAVTANAMKGDKEKCLEAGASDYMSKPIDIEKLIVMIKMWV